MNDQWGSTKSVIALMIGDRLRKEGVPKRLEHPLSLLYMCLLFLLHDRCDDLEGRRPFRSAPPFWFRHAAVKGELVFYKKWLTMEMFLDTITFVTSFLRGGRRS
ncbi:hypothetical protein B1693_01970 [Geobacillus zalihae]|nr:hypothetical protein B1693_01970 [Geobacillus zalihae]